ncbi:MAG TPA: hypothetical protein VEV38_06890 [Candidatus Eremiobacteraceae bacterium]|nr:hypothetical protein [Candidatus Eremiobacteraceae bacterium]
MNIKTAAVSAAILSLGLTFADTTPADAQPWAIVKPIVTKAVAFDVSRPVRSMPVTNFVGGDREVHEYDGPFPRNVPVFNDPVVQRAMGTQPNVGPGLTFEGLPNLNGVLPPDPDGAIGINNFVEMVNLSFAVYDRLGNKLSGPTTIGTLFSGFSISDCSQNSGDPVVLYDRRNDRWILTQFTTAGPNYWNCVAVSQTGDPTGAYYRYAFSAGPNFPDYPKYGDWSDSYILTSRDFGNNGSYGISVYGLEKKKMVAGNPNARSVHFFLDSSQQPIATMGDGLLPSDVDGKAYPANGAPAPVVGTQDDNGPYGATSDALNIYDLTVLWSNPNASTLTGPTQLTTASFNSTFPCGAGGRQCIPQPGTAVKIDFLGYRQRPTFRLAYRKKVGYEQLVTNQSVQASAGVAGVRWYEIRRIAGVYSIYQQGTYAPSDGINRWMGSIAADHHGDLLLGFSVSDGNSTYPGIRFTGRKPLDALGTMTLREGIIQNGSGSQLSSASRWGDYTAMSVDPVDDCTFWYVNQYIKTTGSAPWQTRIGTFKFPGCH